ncbi:MAG: carbohydrate binding family 9 domain-containing protein [Candidatus Eisenbacteria bacterium]|nr:carbohydrate binding family 9 domain-containing protein [Candidatus Eisenbacteria bacterium]
MKPSTISFRQARNSVLACLLGLCGMAAARAETSVEPFALVPLRISAPPLIDGRLDDAVWKQAPACRAFRNFHPHPGAVPSQETHLLIAHDARCLYLAYRCLDDQPAAIRSHLAPRDQAFDDDWVAVIVDAAGDGRSAAQLLVNPEGCQLDARIPGDCSGDHFEVDYPFESAARRDSAGWSAEIAVPFEALQGAGGKSREWLLYGLRHISRTGERAAIPPVDLTDPRWLTKGARLRFEEVGGTSRLELRPAFTCAWHEGRAGSRWKREPPQPRIGIDASARPFGSWTVQATLDPDFSQVEADARQVEVNQRFPVDYPEKRPFFLEGREIFVLAAEGAPLVSAYRSRAIVDPRLGIKLSGEPAAGHALGILFARDRNDEGTDRARETTSPVAILRYRWSAGSRLTAGLFFGVRRTGVQACRAGGLDGDLLLGRRMRLAFHALSSAGSESETSAHDGHAAAVVLERKEQARTTRLSWRQIAPGFLLPAGFVTRTNVREARLSNDERFFVARSFLQRLTLGARATGDWDWEGVPTDRELRLTATAEGRSGCVLEAARSLARERFSGRDFDAGGVRLAARARPDARVGFSLSAEQAAGPYYDPLRPLQGRARTLSGEVTLRIPPAWEAVGACTSYRFSADSVGTVHDGAVLRLTLQCQPARSLELRAIVEWDGFAREVLTDWLVSYRSNGGLVAHAGWGNLYREVACSGDESCGDTDSGGALPAMGRELRRDLFLKVAYAVHPAWPGGAGQQ